MSKPADGLIHVSHTISEENGFTFKELKHTFESSWSGFSTHVSEPSVKLYVNSTKRATFFLFQITAFIMAFVLRVGGNYYFSFNFLCFTDFNFA